MAQRGRDFLYDGLPAHIQDDFRKGRRYGSEKTESGGISSYIRNIRRTTWLLVFLLFLWTWYLRFGEKASFRNYVSSCHWDRWEKWPREADPYRIVIVTDPQIVDPHTYPGRAKRLEEITIKHTDQYMRRSFDRILSVLEPQSVLFLGDLFDGGREWSTLDSDSTVEEMRKLKLNDSFWESEYDRFSHIFLDSWARQGLSGPVEMLANVPGNHDVGFGSGVQLPVRQRFTNHFGPSNRVYVLGNHTFVSVDSPSWSAQGGEGDSPENKAIRQPVEDFLSNIQDQKKWAVSRTLRQQRQEPIHSKLEHRSYKLVDRQNLPQAQQAAADEHELPGILLTHVPLHRAAGTPCGPKRENKPQRNFKPDSSGQLIDAANAIKLEKGFQYQNVIEPALSDELVKRIGGLQHVFSGDDHDYCELYHDRYKSASLPDGLKEITIKSISWAMGIRKPGFLLLSLWNPIDEKARSLSSSPTIQTQLCLLPDQLGIFISYLELLILTLIILVLRAGYLASPPDSIARYSILPTSRSDLSPTEKRDFDDGFEQQQIHSSSSSSSNSSDMLGAELASRSLAAQRPRSVSPLGSYAYVAPGMNLNTNTNTQYANVNAGVNTNQNRNTNSNAYPGSGNGYSVSARDFAAGPGQSTFKEKPVRRTTSASLIGYDARTILHNLKNELFSTLYTVRAITWRKMRVRTFLWEYFRGLLLIGAWGIGLYIWYCITV